MYKVQYGCYEWREETEFETKEEAEQFIQNVYNGKVSLGLYTADYAFLAED